MKKTRKKGIHGEIEAEGNKAIEKVQKLDLLEKRLSVLAQWRTKGALAVAGGSQSTYGRKVLGYAE